PAALELAPLRSRDMKRLLGAVLVLSLLTPVATSAEVPNSPDVFNLTTLNTLDGTGKEIPFTTPQQLAPSYDSSAYSFGPGFEAGERGRVGCASGGGFRFGAKTAWRRIVVGAAGSLTFSAASSYDAMLFAFRTTLPRTARGFGEDVLTTLDCQDE